MAIYSQAEFAELTGKTNAYISVYATRGKIVRYQTETDGRKIWMIDTKEQVNQDFLKLNKPKLDESVLVPEKKKPSQKKESTPAPPPRRQVDEPEANGATGQYELGLEKKNADIEYKEAQTRLLLLKEARERGEQIPIDLVKDLISQMSRSFVSNYKESADKLLIDVSHRTKMSSEDSAKLKGELVKLINDAHDRSLNECIKSFQDSIDGIKIDPDE